MRWLEVVLAAVLVAIGIALMPEGRWWQVVGPVFFISLSAHALNQVVWFKPALGPTPDPPQPRIVLVGKPMRVQPDDVLVVEFEHTVDTDTVVRIKDQVSEVWPENFVVCLSDGMHIYTADAERLKAEIDARVQSEVSH